ncbi:MAG: hypothetical protein ACTSXX_09020 [Candidatus Baldrarchaeia archaeon]
MTSLREWAIKNEVWKPRSWRAFLEKYLVPFYKVAWTLNELYQLLKSEKVCGKATLSDIEDDKLREKIRVAIYGGVERDPETSFAKFMYEHFGICAEHAQSFEESIEHYKNWGDGVKVSIVNSWISSIPIGELVERVHDLIRWNLCRELGIELSEIGLNNSYPYGPIETIDVTTLLPESGEEPKKLISLVNEFRQKAVDLAIGANPFTTFTYYVRAIPVPALIEFLGCDINDIANLANFLGLKAYSMIDLVEVKLPTKSPDKVFLIAETNGLAYKILNLQEYLERIEPTAREVFERMVKEAVDHLKVSFEPWEDYEPIFSFWKEILKDKNWCYLTVEGGKITKLSSYYQKIELPRKIWLRDFLIRLYPAISTGIIGMDRLTSLKFSSFAKKWVEKVIENAGKA